ncbi:hypothetical protein [Aminipila luticellarii]|uniref:hypothetical protein n=1 Tax=Aminipila luticellarii TaxID=2507160 RepID=UPI001E59786D|nr:hypothetical protein [Aminipila luticellarii]
MRQACPRSRRFRADRRYSGILLATDPDCDRVVLLFAKAAAGEKKAEMVRRRRAGRSTGFYPATRWVSFIRFFD